MSNTVLYKCVMQAHDQSQGLLQGAHEHCTFQMHDSCRLARYQTGEADAGHAPQD
jgi:hypothetical protein